MPVEPWLIPTTFVETLGVVPPQGTVPPETFLRLIPRPGCLAAGVTPTEQGGRPAQRFPWTNDLVPAAPWDWQRNIYGVGRALRFLCDVRQAELIQGMREELNNRQLSYITHCLANMWDDSASESSSASTLTMPVLAGVQWREAYGVPYVPDPEQPSVGGGYTPCQHGCPALPRLCHHRR